jgi:predicted RNA binding protein YcfA (HicA-like mRNA interferase family)
VTKQSTPPIQEKTGKQVKSSKTDKLSKLPVISGKDMEKCLSNIGFTVVRVQGNHLKMRRHDSSGLVTVIIPKYDELDRRTLKCILRIIGISTRRFLEMR